MKFKKIEPIVQIESDWVRHKISTLPEGEFIQKCNVCDAIIKDCTPQKNGFTICWDGNHNRVPYKERGMMEGYVFTQGNGHTSTTMHECMGTPKIYNDCTVVNS